MNQFLTPTFEILIIAVLIYSVLNFFWNTRAMDLILGVGALLIFFSLINWLNLPVLQKIAFYLANVALLGLLIIFQPELRIAISRLSVKSKTSGTLSEFDHFIDELAQTIYRLAERKVGALVVLENQDSLDEFANRAVRLNAKFSPELLESIFSTATPLHDGAIILRGDNILSAATILPLAEESAQLSKSMGTRHRAGLGISEITDALIIVVSEETGRVSIARQGIITRGVKIDRFKGIVRSVYTFPQTTKPKSIWSRLLVWIRQ